jgi:hypothetical protein
VECIVKFDIVIEVLMENYLKFNTVKVVKTCERHPRGGLFRTRQGQEFPSFGISRVVVWREVVRITPFSGISGPASADRG